MNAPDSQPVSIVVFAPREVRELGPWHEAIEPALGGAAPVGEVTYAVSDRCPRMVAAVEQLRAQGSTVGLVVLTHWFDEAAALQRALGRCRGVRVLTLPAGGDVAPSELPRLLRALDDADLALARRVDVALSRAPERPASLLDRASRRLFGAGFADPGCRTRAYRRAVLETLGDRSVPLALMPLLAAWHGFAVREVTVRAAGFGEHSGSGPLRRAPYVVATIFLYLLLSFAKRPLQLFGAVGSLALVAGLALTLPLAVARVSFGEPLADEPALIPGLLLTALGIQCAVVGLLAELLVSVRSHAIEDDVGERVLE